jgi:hypothetical protein
VQAELLGAHPYRVEAHPAQQHVGGQVVARRADERRQVGERKRRHDEVLPDARLADGVALQTIDETQRARVAGLEPRGHLDEQEHLADRRGRHDDVVVDGEQHGTRREVDGARRHLHAGERELAEGGETAAETVSRLASAVLAATSARVSSSAF